MNEAARPGRHWGWLAWVLLGLAVGLSGGFFWGSYAGACSGNDECSARWDAVGAVGTWVGGLGTIAAVLVAAQAFQVEEHARRRVERMAKADAAERDAAFLAAAQLVSMQASIGSCTGEEVTEVRVTVTNASSDTTAYRVSVNAAKIGRSFEVHRIEAGESKPFSHEMFPGSGYPSLHIPIQERPQWLVDLLEMTTVTFEMNGRWWSRTGSRPTVGVRES